MSGSIGDAVDITTFILNARRYGVNARMLLARFGRNINPRRCFSAATRVLEKPLPPRRVISDEEITEAFVKGSGPGGQKINKTSCAVQIKHLPTGIVVKCQATRSREQNRKTARKILAEKLEELEKGDESRAAMKAERARTKKASADKKSRRKYKLLAEEKAAKAQDETDRDVGSSMSDEGVVQSGEGTNDAPPKS